MKVRSLALAALLFVAVPAFGQGTDRAHEGGACAVRGRVVDPAGHPLPEVGILISATADVDTATALTQPSAKTDADGHFEVGVPAKHVLVFAARGRATALATPTEKPNPLMPTPPRATDGIDLDVILPPAVDLRGRVLAEGGSALPGARITAIDMVAERHSKSRPPSPHDVRYTSTTLSGADGRFVLAGVFATGLQLDVRAPGHFSQVLRPVDRGTPLTFELTPSGVCRGHVLDADGHGVVASVYASFEGGDDDPSTQSAVDGSFELPLRHPGGYRLRAFDRRTNTSGESERLSGPTDAIALTLRPRVPLDFVVRAVDAEGQPVQEFTAGVHWIPADNAFVQVLTGIAPVTAAVDGVARLAKPGPNQPEQGSLSVTAKGYAQAILEVRWDPAKPEVEVKLQPESVVAGRVLGTDGKPLANVRVRVAKPAARPAGLPAGFEFNVGRPWTGASSGEVLSEADGTFRAGGLAAGEYEVAAWPYAHPPVAPVNIGVGAGEQKTDVVIEVARGATLQGKLRGDRPDVPAYLTIAPVADGVIVLSAPRSGANGRRIALGPDDTFTVSGLARGKHELTLALDAHPRSVAPVLLRLGQVDVGGKDLTHTFDLPAAAQTTLRGKLLLEGATVPMDRLLVVSQPVGDDGPAFVATSSTMGDWASPSRAIADQDGGFTLRVVPGRQRVEVCDLLTGLKLGEPDDPVAVGKEGGACEIKLALGKVRVTLRTPADARGLVSRLELRQALDPNDPIARFGGTNDFDLRTGLLVAPGQASIEFEAPLGSLEIRARNEDRLGNRANRPLAKAEVMVTAKKVAEVTLEPSLPDGNK